MANVQYTRDDAKITVLIRGVAYEGWLQSEVTRSLEAICGTFSIPVSMIPGQPPAIYRQDVVQVRIGNTTIITGYVLAAEPFYRRGDCGMRIVGRDRTGDLVRCSAVHAGGQWRNVGLQRIVQDLAAPFGLDVVADVDLGAPIKDFKLGHGESVLDALSRAARLRGVLVTRDDQGRLLLTKAGQKRFKGEIRRGSNVIEMQGIGSDEERHSEYIAYGQSNTLSDDVENFNIARSLKGVAADPEIKRYLPLVINGQGNTTADELQALAEHTLRVRRGHSLGYRYTVEGWTFEGEPWPLNQRVAIHDDVAGLNGAEWLICSVRQTCDLKEGDVTELVVRPIEAYDDLPVKTKAVRRNWGNQGNTTNHPARGPEDKARGGE
jgi:prophage tail gpP-like protein